MTERRLVIFAGMVLATLSGCRDVSRFSTRGDHYEGDVVKGSFVRAGIGEDVRMCLTLDADHLQDSPGTLTTSDGRFRTTRMRPVPQLWHDPLSTLSFGDGRRQNLLYMVAPEAKDSAGDTIDATAIVSLMDRGGVEVRILRGAPDSDGGAPPSDGGPSLASIAPPLFAIFTLERREGPCTF